MAGPRNARWSEVAVAATILAVPVAMVAMAYDFGTEARRLPLTIGWPLTAMAAANLVLQIRAALRQTGGADEEASLGWEAGASDQQVQVAQLRKQVENQSVGRHANGLSGPMLLGVAVVLVVLLLVLGLLVAAPVFVLLFMRLVGRHSWRAALLTAAGLTATFLLFAQFLDVSVYAGFVGELLPV